MLSTTRKCILDRFEEIRSIYHTYLDHTQPWQETWHYEGKWDFIYARVGYKNIIPIDMPDNIVNAGFSIMRPGTEVLPHQGYEGYADKVWRCHMTLYESDDSCIKVGNHVYNYKEKTIITFDDSCTHSAWNRGKTDRVSFLFDVERYGKVEMTKKMLQRHGGI